MESEGRGAAEPRPCSPKSKLRLSNDTVTGPLPSYVVWVVSWTQTLEQADVSLPPA